MSTNHHQVYWEVYNSSRTCEFTGESVVRETLYFFSGIVAPGDAEAGSLFPQVRGSIWESCQQKAHRILVIARFPLQHVKKTQVHGCEALLEDEVGKMCMRL